MSGKVYFEIRRFGNSVKVTAIDEETTLEVSIVGPANLPRSSLEQQALRKLEYVKNKKKEE